MKKEDFSHMYSEEDLNEAWKEKEQKIIKSIRQTKENKCKINFLQRQDFSAEDIKEIVNKIDILVKKISHCYSDLEAHQKQFYNFQEKNFGSVKNFDDLLVNKQSIDQGFCHPYYYIVTNINELKSNLIPIELSTDMYYR